MAMAHPIHLHGEQLQILSRTIKDSHGSSYATATDDLINSGWKSTVLVMLEKNSRLSSPFQNCIGLYLYHGHNLEHEDMGMMRNFLVS